MSRKFNAILGLGALAAFGFASSAFAQCPTGPVPPWSSQSSLGGSLAITTPGFDTTSCKLDASITLNGPGVSAFVRDNTPAAEARYRAQFIVNVDTLTGLNSAQSVRLFSANTETPHLGITEAVRISVFGNLAGTQKSIGVVAGCEGAPSNLCSANIPLAAGPNRIELDWDAAGTVRVWVNNTTEGSPNATLTGNTSGWEVDFAVLGLSTASPQFRANQLNRVVSFDEFDSRRTSFIGG